MPSNTPSVIHAADIEFTEHPDVRFPGRTILVGTHKPSGIKVFSSFRGRREVAERSNLQAIADEIDAQCHDK